MFTLSIYLLKINCQKVFITMLYAEKIKTLNEKSDPMNNMFLLLLGRFTLKLPFGP